MQPKILRPLDLRLGDQGVGEGSRGNLKLAGAAPQFRMLEREECPVRAVLCGFKFGV